MSSPAKSPTTQFVVEWALTVVMVGLFTTLSVWLGLYLGQQYQNAQVLGFAAWVGMVFLYVLNFFKSGLKKIMVRHLDEALFKYVG